MVGIRIPYQEGVISPLAHFDRALILRNELLKIFWVNKFIYYTKMTERVSCIWGDAHKWRRTTNGSALLPRAQATLNV